jgi:phosphoglycerate kinase
VCASPSLKSLSLQSATVLVRVDFNVPVDEKGNIVDTARIEAAATTLRYLLEKNCKVILLSHRGRPKGKVDPALSLDVCIPVLQELVKVPVHFAKSCRGKEARDVIEKACLKEVVLLENTRFIPAEETPSLDPSFAQELADFADFFVFDAFGTAHRLHSSTAKIIPFFPKRCAFGFLVEKEVAVLNVLFSHPKRPYYVLLGGAKLSTKISLLQSVLQRADKVFIGGAMSYTFLRVKGFEVGHSFVEEGQLEKAEQLLKGDVERKIVLPIDHIEAAGTKAFRGFATKGVDIGKKLYGVDIGPKTIHLWQEQMRGCASLFWNGPLGVYENAAFIRGTEEIARFLSMLPAKVVVGGGDVGASLRSLGMEQFFFHISTGGGAALAFLEKGHLPVLDLIDNQWVR